MISDYSSQREAALFTESVHRRDSPVLEEELTRGTVNSVITVALLWGSGLESDSSHIKPVTTNQSQQFCHIEP